MKALILSSVMLALVACETTVTNVTGYKGTMPIGTVVVNHFLYGSLNYSNTLFGIIQTGELNIGFQQLSSMYSTLVAAYVAGDVAKAMQVTTQLKNAGATQSQIATIQASAQETAQGLKAGVFKHAGTTFAQPAL